MKGYRTKIIQGRVSSKKWKLWHKYYLIQIGRWSNKYMGTYMYFRKKKNV